jgi:hypothetical protein
MQANDRDEKDLHVDEIMNVFGKTILTNMYQTLY